jgi:hypothetical protein
LPVPCPESLPAPCAPTPCWTRARSSPDRWTLIASWDGPCTARHASTGRVWRELRRSSETSRVTDIREADATRAAGRVAAVPAAPPRRHKPWPPAAGSLPPTLSDAFTQLNNPDALRHIEGIISTSDELAQDEEPDDPSIYRLDFMTTLLYATQLLTTRSGQNMMWCFISAGDAIEMAQTDGVLPESLAGGWRSPGRHFRDTGRIGTGCRVRAQGGPETRIRLPFRSRNEGQFPLKGCGSARMAPSEHSHRRQGAGE